MDNAIYLRTSTDDQTPQLQLRDIATLVRIEDAILLEETVSAWKDNVARPAFDNLKALIKSRKVSSLYVWHLDRIYRNRKRLVEFLSLCRNYGVSVFSFNQKWIVSIQQMDAPFNEIMFDFMLQIIGWIAEDESTTKSNRVRMSVRKTEEGTFSHKGNKWGRKAMPKQTVTRVLELHKAGNSIRAIASEVQIYDKNKNGKPISKSAVHKIIVDNAMEKGSKTLSPTIN